MLPHTRGESCWALPSSLCIKHPSLPFPWAEAKAILLFPAFPLSHLALARLSVELNPVKSAPLEGLDQQGAVTAQSHSGSREGMQQKCLSRTSGTALVENLQPQARALGPLFIPCDTERARLSYPGVFICSSGAFPDPNTTGWEEEPRRCRLRPAANPADPGIKGRRYFTSLGWDLAAQQSPGEGAQPAFPQDRGIRWSSASLLSPGTRGISQLCLLAPPSPCLYQLCQLEPWNILSGKGPTGISEIQLLALHRTTQQSLRALSQHSLVPARPLPPFLGQPGQGDFNSCLPESLWSLGRGFVWAQDCVVMYNEDAEEGGCPLELLAGGFPPPKALGEDEMGMLGAGRTRTGDLQGSLVA